MPFDGITIKAITHELNADLIDSRIDKIYQPEKDEIILSLRKPRIGSFRLLISTNPQWSRLHISSEKKVNPKKAPTFCMLLRKHLEGGKIKEVKQLELERIVHIRIEALNDFGEWKDKTLVCELMGKHSNLILIDPDNNIILDAINRYGSDISSYREVLPGKEYLFPPSQGKLNPFITQFDVFAKTIWENHAEAKLPQALFRTFTGISPFSAKELCLNAGLENNTPVEQCGEFELSKIYNYLISLLTDIDKGVIYPCVVENDNKLNDFAPFQIGNNCTKFESMNLACDYFYANKLAHLKLESTKSNLIKNLKSNLDRLYKKDFYQQGDYEKAIKNEKYKVWGELITAFSHQIKKGQSKTELENFYTGNYTTIDLDPRYTPIENAQRYFKIYNKSQKSLKHLEKLMAKNKKEISYLESVIHNISLAETHGEIAEIIEELEKEGYVKEKSKASKSSKTSKAKQEKSQPRKYLSSDNYIIYVGRNNRQNDILTTKEADRYDIWLHARNIPGSHVIINCNKKINKLEELPNNTLEEAASLAAYFSNAQDADKVEIDYTFRLNVRKPPGAKPGMVTYDKFKTILVNPQSEYNKKFIVNNQSN
ncbi:Fibronectin/fibrinogen-binding protein [Candidatus Syntrophocurvum alkaliphilum]|uniref:Rqc2 homolog RqcH n=1 Tax=Candidatus Syntrophocurvum alkaliphilum TaxID=2293317 RepID=A0A6I6DJV8_9FIRM|nr:NFACT RNA binding domain-containing protein [Candidatus Syntrophocurvum alkaliphilum]QGT99661.1 Fibronectin/fibrinogen-binding protein [Candidatus Syntrophocurvum alkaliphilum]